MTGGPLRLDDPKLAINGGAPVRTAPWLDNFTFDEAEERAAVAALRSGYLSKFEGSHTPDPPFSFWGGPLVQELERRWAELYQTRHAVSVNSATSGLFAALGALRIGYGDEVIVSPSTMTACAVGPLLYGAIPVFADVEETTGALDPAAVAARITPRTRAIIVVHQFGVPADMDPIMTTARRHGLKVIEDCAQAHGARYKGRPVGGIGDVGVFSLNVNKAIQCGEGGVCVTNDDELRYRLALIRNHGEAVVGPAGCDDIVNILGFNYRLTEIQAAVALEQMKKLDVVNRTRIDYVRRLNDRLRGRPHLTILDGREECDNTFYTWPILYRPEAGGCDVETFRNALNAEGMYFLRGYQPLYRQPIYQRRVLFKGGYPFAAPENRDSRPDYGPGACPMAESLRERLLIKEYVRYPSTVADLDDIVAAFDKLEGRR